MRTQNPEPRTQNPEPRTERTPEPGTMNPEPIRIVVTGGTFDKEYHELTGALAFKETHLPEMLRLGRSRVDASITTLMMIDSLEMTDADRALIVGHCRQAAEARILITQ